jgi:superfamily II DNA/RNA helicase
MGDSARLLRLLGLAMAPRVAEFVEDKLWGVDKVVVFFKHTDVGRALAERLSGQGVVVYEGGMSDRQKDEAKARFANESCSVFLGQWQAAGTGVDGLQRVSSTMVMAEPGWTPGETEQWVDRLDRMGQEDEIVNAYAMHARGTLSAIVAKVHDLKAHRAAGAVGAA